MRNPNIYSITISHFVAGSGKELPEGKRKFFQSKFIKLSFSTTEGDNFVLEILKSNHQSDIEYKARELSKFCHVPLYVENL